MADCYNCQHRRSVPGDAHSKCEHPKATLISAITGINYMGVRLNPHGVRNGWALWPINFDPIWIDECKGFTSRG